MTFAHMPKRAPRPRRSGSRRDGIPIAAPRHLSPKSVPAARCSSSMPLAGKFRCFAFTYASIRQNAPRCSGVYVISNSKEWLFIGAADDLQSALHKHLMETGTLLKSKAPTGFTFEACDPAARQ